MSTVFVVLWSSGFIGAKWGLPYAEPFTFLLVRFWIVTALILFFVLLSRAPWPPTWTQACHIAVAGLLIHATYLGGVFASLYHGLPAGISALVVSLQPLLTAAIVGPFLGEKVSPRQWLGFVLGLFGVTLVVLPKISYMGASSNGLLFSVVALFGITLGTLYQKKYCGAMDLRTGAVIQYASSGTAMLILAPEFEHLRIHWTEQFVFALSWLTIVLSLGAVTLLYLLIRRGKAARVASTFYLVPPCTALMGYIFFGETLSSGAIFGMTVTTVGVALVNG